MMPSKITGLAQIQGIGSSSYEVVISCHLCLYFLFIIVCKVVL